ncbi:MAG: hypothetical protein QOD88_2534, partial [Mycobacterium sp.]|nr:hypothetical protein [Mycobacterium sp.]
EPAAAALSGNHGPGGYPEGRLWAASASLYERDGGC